jgi:hypothetical protein
METEKMTFGATDIANRGVDDFRETLRVREAELVNARKQRDVILNDIRKASDAAGVGDQRARLGLAGLNKQDAAAGRLILSLEADVREAKKRLAIAENQAATAAAKRASVDAPAVTADKWFEVSCPDNRKVRHRSASLESLQRALRPGYRIIGQAFGTKEDGSGGFVSMPGAPSMLKALLESQGDELLSFLAAHGIIGSDKRTVVVLPANNRELQ